MDATSLRLVRETLLAEQVNLLQYLAQANLWVSPAQRPALLRLRELAQSEADLRRQLETRLAQARFAIPPTDSFPAEFTAYNCIALRSVWPRLVQSLQHDLARLETTLARLDDPQARSYLEPLIAHKRQTLAALQGLSP